MKLMQTPQRRILSKFQVDRYTAVSVMSHRTRSFSRSVDVPIVRPAVSVGVGIPSQTMDRPPVEDDDEPGRLIRQGTFPLGRSSLRKQGSLRRTKSFRVTFAEKITTNEGDTGVIITQETPPPTPSFPKVEELESPPNASTSKQKITNRRKPTRRPTSHVPRNIRLLVDEDFEDQPPEIPRKEDVSPSPSKSSREGRRTSLSQFIDQTVLNPLEEKLHQLAIKYRKPKEETKSRIPIPAPFKPTRVSSLASKYERKYKNINES